MGCLKYHQAHKQRHRTAKTVNFHSTADPPLMTVGFC